MEYACNENEEAEESELSKEAYDDKDLSGFDSCLGLSRHESAA